MWKKYPEISGFYWYFYIKNKITIKVVCQYEKISNIVLFPGDNSVTPIEHLDSLDGFWYGPLKEPETLAQ